MQPIWYQFKRAHLWVTVLDQDGPQRSGRKLWDQNRKMFLWLHELFMASLFLWNASSKSKHFFSIFFNYECFIKYKKQKPLRVTWIKSWRSTHLSVRPCKHVPIDMWMELSSVFPGALSPQSQIKELHEYTGNVGIVFQTWAEEGNSGSVTVWVHLPNHVVRTRHKTVLERNSGKAATNICSNIRGRV